MSADCQRCSEVLRDHIMRQKPNSARCTREQPCDDCRKVLDHFSLSGNQLWQKFDERAQHNRLKRAQNSADAANARSLGRSAKSQDGGGAAAAGGAAGGRPHKRAKVGRASVSMPGELHSSAPHRAVGKGEVATSLNAVQRKNEFAALLASLHNQPFDATVKGLASRGGGAGAGSTAQAQQQAPPTAAAATDLAAAAAAMAGASMMSGSMAQPASNAQLLHSQLLQPQLLQAPQQQPQLQLQQQPQLQPQPMLANRPLSDPGDPATEPAPMKPFEPTLEPQVQHPASGSNGTPPLPLEMTAVLPTQDQAQQPMQTQPQQQQQQQQQTQAMVTGGNDTATAFKRGGIGLDDGMIAAAAPAALGDSSSPRREQGVL